MSIGNGRFSAALFDHCGRSPAFLSRRTVASASAPVMSARSRPPERISFAASVASTWGTDPPMPE